MRFTYKKAYNEIYSNNFMQYTMLNPGPLLEYIGFTEEKAKFMIVLLKNTANSKSSMQQYKLSYCCIELFAYQDLFIEL